MSFTVRSLLNRIKPLRPELSDGSIDYVLQEVTRRMMRETFLGQVTQDVFILPSGVNQICLSQTLPWWDATIGINSLLPNERQLILPATESAPTSIDSPTQKNPADVMRVMRVRVARPLYSLPSYNGVGGQGDALGYFPLPTLTSAELPDPTTVGTGDFYVAYASGTATVDGSTDTVTFNEGDVIQSDGTQWAIYDRTTFWNTTEINQPTTDSINTQPQNYEGTPLRWSQKYGPIVTVTPTYTVVDPPSAGTVAYTQHIGMNVLLYPRPNYDTAIELTYSYVPVGDFGDQQLSLPNDAVDCIVNGALADLLLYPGENQNLQLAEAKRFEYERLKGKLTAIAVLGYGSAYYKSPQFGAARRAGTAYYAWSNSPFYPGI